MKDKVDHVDMTYQSDLEARQRLIITVVNMRFKKKDWNDARQFEWDTWDTYLKWVNPYY